MFNIVNKLPQPLNLLINGNTEILTGYGNKFVNDLTQQIINFNKKGFIRICKVKNKGINK